MFSRAETKALRAELKAACKAGRDEQNRLQRALTHNVKLSNGWTVKIQPIWHCVMTNVRTPWKNHYYLIDPTGLSYGGYDLSISFERWAIRFLEEQQ